MFYIHKLFIIYLVLLLPKSSQLGDMCKQMCRRLQRFLMPINLEKNANLEQRVSKLLRIFLNRYFAAPRPTFSYNRWILILIRSKSHRE